MICLVLSTPKVKVSTGMLMLLHAIEMSHSAVTVMTWEFIRYGLGHYLSHSIILYSYVWVDVIEAKSAVWNEIVRSIGSMTTTAPAHLQFEFDHSCWIEPWRDSRHVSEAALRSLHLIRILLRTYVEQFGSYVGVAQVRIIGSWPMWKVWVCEAGVDMASHFLPLISFMFTFILYIILPSPVLSEILYSFQDSPSFVSDKSPKSNCTVLAPIFGTIPIIDLIKPGAIS